MPNRNGFDYDVFISYSSEDREWAAKVKSLLGKRRIFFDQTSIRAGDDWETTIMDSLEASQNLVVLWSEHAKSSAWVNAELMQFKRLAPARQGTNRRLIPLNLQGTNALLNNYQQINHPEVQKAYPNIGSVKAPDWTEIDRRLSLGLDPKRETMEVPVLILTLTKDRLSRFDDETWAEIERAFGVDRNNLPDFYDAKRRDLWRPFGGTRTVTEILEEIRLSLDDALPTRRLEWRYPDEKFWTDTDEARRFLGEEFKNSELSLLILDPIAFHDRNELRRLQMTQPAVTRSSAAIVVLPPFAPWDRLSSFRRAVDDGGTPFFDEYFRPTVPPSRPLAQLCWNASDPLEIQRYFLHAAGASLKTHQRESVSPYVNHGDS